MKSLRYSNISYRQQGMTLPELLLVILLLGTFAFSSSHSWHNYQQSLRLEASAYQLLAFLTQLQSEANWYNSKISLWREQYQTTWCIGRIPLAQECKVQDADIFISPYDDILLSDFSFNKMTFSGKHNTATSGHITLANSSGKITVFLTAYGRLRLCSKNIQLTGIPKC